MGYMGYYNHGILQISIPKDIKHADTIEKFKTNVIFKNLPLQKVMKCLSESDLYAELYRL